MLRRNSLIARVILSLGAGAVSQVAYAAPPTEYTQTYHLDANQIAPGQCAFPVDIVVQGKSKTITLPGNRVIITAPGQSATVTNLSDPKKTVTLNITGATHQSVQNGDNVYVLTGRNLAGDPDAGLVLAIGNFSFVFDAQGSLVQPR